LSTWLITGCSTGLGRHLAEAVLKKGFNVVVTARDLDKVRDLGSAFKANALTVALDVTDRAQVTAAVKRAEEHFGGIDVLVNNAGFGYRAAVEEGDEAQVEALFATNFFGLVRMTKAVLPGMRARRSGTIVNLSSIAGRRSAPGSGYYSASKFAVAGMSDALRKEVGPLGVRVIVIEPGAFRTDFSGRSLTGSSTKIADYDGTAGPRRKGNDKSHGTQAGDPARAAQAMIEAVALDNPPFRLLLGTDAVAGASAELDAQRQELETFRSLSTGTDFQSR
jgi:NADP-dependent 3-hydroxy acid dehydrogenase YdfG